MTLEQQIADLKSQLRHQRFVTEAVKTNALNPEQTATILASTPGDPAEVIANAKADPANQNLWIDPHAPVDVSKLSHDEYLAMRRDAPERLGIGGYPSSVVGSSVTTDRADFLVDAPEQSDE